MKKKKKIGNVRAAPISKDDDDHLSSRKREREGSLVIDVVALDADAKAADFQGGCQFHVVTKCNAVRVRDGKGARKRCVICLVCVMQQRWIYTYIILLIELVESRDRHFL